MDENPAPPLPHPHLPLTSPPPPPPPPPPPQLSVRPGSLSSPSPCPGQAVIPFAPHESDYPVQETNPTPEALQGAQGLAPLTAEDERAIRTLMELGHPRELVLQVYWACNRNANEAANILNPEGPSTAQ